MQMVLFVQGAANLCTILMVVYVHYVNQFLVTAMVALVLLFVSLVFLGLCSHLPGCVSYVIILFLGVLIVQIVLIVPHCQVAITL